MKHKKKIRSLAVLMIAVILGSVYTVPARTTIDYTRNPAPMLSEKSRTPASLSESVMTLRAGKKKQLKCQGVSGTVKWKSSKTSVAKVDQKGNVTAVKPGKAVISVSGGNLIGKMECEVRVSRKITQKQAGQKLNSLKKKYKEGMSWTNENNSYFWEAENCYCSGCIAFAGELSDQIFGKYAPVTTHKSFDKIKTGDHIRIGNVHSVIVLKKKKDSVIVAEGNYNESVHWGREITKSELEETGFYVDTRY